MSDRLTRLFAALAVENRAALIPFITGGDPDMATSTAILHALPVAGADIIEVGIPFSDPSADGVAIQAASERALAAGATLTGILAMVQQWRVTNAHTPLILMGYFNPIFRYGVTRFAADAVAAGVDGVILVDLPPEEHGEVAAPFEAVGLHIIRLATPTTDAARLPAVVASASGFLYYVSVAGVTGGASGQQHDIATAVTDLKAASGLPVAVGFGIKTPQQAAQIARVADGVVVGSALVTLIAQSADSAPEQAAAFVARLAAAVRSARIKENRP